MNDEPIKILLIDDDEDDFIVARDLLDESQSLAHTLNWIHQYDDALEAIKANQYDVYLLDYRLGEKTGLDLLKEAVSLGCRAPIILLTGQGADDIDLKAMKAGASDYLIKGEINTPLLERSIRYSLERKKNEENVFKMAYYDNLTGLPNRMLFQDRLKQALSHGKRYEKTMAVMFLDVDNFKRINDTFGHSIGDKLLKGVAERLTGTMRETDSVARQNPKGIFARLGGDEFTVLLGEITSPADAAKVAQRIIDTMARPFNLDGNEIFITTSIGIAISPDDGETIDDLLKNADAAMYHAKEQGKDNYQYYRQSMNAAAFEKMTMENRLRKAVERDELTLYYQPQFNITTGAITGLEALVRWNHPEEGLVPPGKFIPVAEETGIIIPLSEWVLKAAARQSRAWSDEGYAGIPVSVNISCRHFQHKNLVESIETSLASAGVTPENIMVEITESAIMQNTESVMITLTELADMGIKLILDDFGTGYSSLSYLKRFPIHALKIDRSFTDEIENSPDEAVIARAIISLAKNLKMMVVAEGVETMQQLSYLKSFNCDEVQGYLLSRPVPAHEITQMLADEKNGEGPGKTIIIPDRAEAASSAFR